MSLSRNAKMTRTTQRNWQIKHFMSEGRRQLSWRGKSDCSDAHFNVLGNRTACVQDFKAEVMLRYGRVSSKSRLDIASIFIGAKDDMQAWATVAAQSPLDELRKTCARKAAARCRN
jgi:hypothetical protein